MKSFYSTAVVVPVASTTGVDVPAGPPVQTVSHIRTRARIAVYDALSAAPRIVDVEPAPVGEFIEALSARVHELSRSEGGSIPYTVIREVAENFIHADFAEPVVSILDAGSTIRFADQGPGIADKDRALLPGFTTAAGELKRYIRGVGSGLPIVRDFLVHSGGSLAIEDNLGVGSVVTIHAGRTPHNDATAQRPVPIYAREGVSVSGDARQASFEAAAIEPQEAPVARPRLSARQKNVLALVLESGLAGPSLVSKELGVGISTAYRDLAMLEEVGLIASEAGKRT
ncbi:MAG: ATP-binding protein, partial [Coriobacteriia bacterium]|nr:ATP-binding protein [Coriobacteriia bacterium]